MCYFIVKLINDCMDAMVNLDLKEGSIYRFFVTLN